MPVAGRRGKLCRALSRWPDSSAAKVWFCVEARRQQRSKYGNKCLKIAFHHAAVRAIQYFPEIQRFYRNMALRKPKAVARALVAKELARAVYFVLTRQEAFNGTFKGQPLNRTKQPRWPRLANPPV